MRNRFDNLSDLLCKEDGSFGRAPGAGYPAAARVGYEKVMSAFITARPRHFSLLSMQALPILRDAAIQKGVERLHHFCPLRMTPGIYPLKCLRHNRWQKPKGYRSACIERSEKGVLFT